MLILSLAGRVFSQIAGEEPPGMGHRLTEGD